ncbi:MAG: TrbG/VirB9 family P-type conjugative transfer protein [Acidobacteria bacterium]|nr:TrbG/VirB9 family P-type conjugative transfer protein [Acidobacteriota bacterium]
MRRSLTVLAVLLSLALSSPPVRAQGARQVTYSPESVVPLRAKLRFTTMIILPEQEQILDFVCGDKEFWAVSGAQNLAYVKPAKAGAVTNLNLVTASGRVYSFVLTEGTAEPDLKVFVQLDAATAAASGAQKFYTARQVEDLQREIDDARHDAEDARKQLEGARSEAAKIIEQQVDEFRASFPTKLQFPYRFKAHQRPFNVSAIFTDGRFTYIRAEASELPALYEVVSDGRGTSPNLVNFQVEQGLYIVPKVLDRGYMAIGKDKLTFEIGQ